MDVGGLLTIQPHGRITLTTVDEEQTPEQVADEGRRSHDQRPHLLFTRSYQNPRSILWPPFALRMIASTLSSLSFSPASTRLIIFVRVASGVAGQETSKIALAGKFKMALCLRDSS